MCTLRLFIHGMDESEGERSSERQGKIESETERLGCKSFAIFIYPTGTVDLPMLTAKQNIMQPQNPYTEPAAAALFHLIYTEWCNMQHINFNENRCDIKNTSFVSFIVSLPLAVFISILFHFGDKFRCLSSMCTLWIMCLWICRPLFTFFRVRLYMCAYMREWGIFFQSQLSYRMDVFWVLVENRCSSYLTSFVFKALELSRFVCLLISKTSFYTTHTWRAGLNIGFEQRKLSHNTTITTNNNTIQH